MHKWNKTCITIRPRRPRKIEAQTQLHDLIKAMQAVYIKLKGRFIAYQRR